MKHVYTLNSKTKLTDVVEVDVQPNAVDLRVEKIFQTNPSTFVLSEDKKTHRGSKELPTRRFQDEDDWWCLQPGYYEVHFKNKIKVAKGEAGFVITRSTLVRNGVYIISGLYDSGYEGGMVAGLHVTTSPFYVKKWTRLGQYLSFDAEMIKMYDGAYGTRNVIRKNQEYVERLEKRAKGLTKNPLDNLIKFPKGKPKPKEVEFVNDEDEEMPKPSRNIHETVEDQIKSEVDELKGILD